MTTANTGEQAIPEDVRDKVFAEIRPINNNNMCFDCEKKNTKWASIHLGINLCYDCAGKHRQYGVMHSFIKSTNLDGWNHKQILYMQKGGNSRAHEYLSKKGIISGHNKHVDYKSAVVQQYKAILTQEVQLELNGGAKNSKNEEKGQKNEIKDNFFNGEAVTNKIEEKKQIPTAEEVNDKVVEKTKKKKDKKKIGAKQLDIEFESMVFDDGVPIEEKQKIVKEYQKQKDKTEENLKTQPETPIVHEKVEIKIEQPKQLSAEEAKKKLEELKHQNNVKAISSDQFKDNSLDEATQKQNLNKFKNATSISSAQYYNEPADNSGEAMDKIKDMVGNVGGTLLNKLSGYWKK